MLPSVLRRARKAQVGAVTRLCLGLARLPLGGAVVRALGASRLLERLLVGHRRGFATRQEAERCIQEFGFPSHEHPDAIRQHISFGEQARPSDYPALFHLHRLLPEVAKIVDIGGSTGNLFYCYAKYLDLPPDFSWTVFDMEAAVEAGRELARERGEARLAFSTELERCQPADLVLISGALHFFEASPIEMLSSWAEKPKHILINRSPVTHEASLYGVQDQGTWLTAAKVLNHEELVSAMRKGGYALVDEWPVLELQMRFPLRPRNSVGSYSGFLFSRVPVEGGEASR